jgi:hypothetical protein
MKTDLLPALRDRYPQLFSSPSLREVECLPGWFQLLNGLCEAIRRHLDCHAEVPKIKVVRIKEKWGELRFYYIGGDPFCQQLVDDAVAASLKICEVCGDHGELVGERWVSVRCAAHANWSPSWYSEPVGGE